MTYLRSSLHIHLSYDAPGWYWFIGVGHYGTHPVAEGHAPDYATATAHALAAFNGLVTP